MRKTLTLFVILLLGGAARSAPITGVVVQSCELSREKGMWVMHLANVSNKNVVYVNITTSDHRGVGSYYAEVEREYTAPLRESGEFIPRGGETFAPSTTRDLLLGMDASQCAAPVIDVVVYADDTAEVVNEDAFRHYILPMEEKVLTLKKENEIIAQFASSQSRVADTVGELLRVASDLPDPQIRHDEDAHVNSNDLVALARDLKQGKVSIEAVIKDNAEQIEIESKHGTSSGSQELHCDGPFFAKSRRAAARP